MMLSPMKPQTTDGVAARSSTSTFSVSRVLPVANSPMKIAAPRAKGTATSIAPTVTLAVPTIRARRRTGARARRSAPVGRGEEVAEVELRHHEAGVFQAMNTKIAITNTIAEMPRGRSAPGRHGPTRRRNRSCPRASPRDGSGRLLRLGRHGSVVAGASKRFHQIAHVLHGADGPPPGRAFSNGQRRMVVWNGTLRTCSWMPRPGRELEVVHVGADVVEGRRHRDVEVDALRVCGLHERFVGLAGDKPACAAERACVGVRLAGEPGGQEACARASAVDEEEVERLLRLALTRLGEERLLGDVLGLVDDPLEAVARRRQGEGSSMGRCRCGPPRRGLRTRDRRPARTC